MNNYELYDADTKNIQYAPTDEEAKIIWFVRQRIAQMKNARSVIDRERPIYQRMIEAVLEPYGDERSSSNVPLATALIESYVADATRISTDFICKAETTSYADKAKALEHVRKYDWRKNKRKKPFLENEYTAAGYGTSIIYTGFESFTQKQKDMVIWEDEEITRVEKEIKTEQIIVKNIDIRDFYVDDRAINDFDDAIDCHLRERQSYEDFKKLETNQFYKNIDKVAPRQYSDERRTFEIQEDAVHMQQSGFVLKEWYWNTSKDCWICIANDVLVRDTPMVSTIDGKKALPFAVRNLGKKIYSIYGRGFCEASLMFNSEINNLRELCMDAIRRSNVSVLAIGSGLSFKDRDFSYENEILTFDGKLDSSTFQQISGTPPNQAIFWYMDKIMQDISIYVGIDIQNIMGESKLTAFQSELKRDSSQKRINVWLTNRDLAFERFADLHKDNLQKFFPRKTAEGIYPQIEVDGEELVEKNGEKKFRKKKGKHMFEVTPDLLQGDIYIDVYTNTTAPTVNAVDRQQKLEVMQAIWPIVQWFALAKQAGFDLDTVMPLKKTIQDLMDDYNFEVPDTASTDNHEVEEGKKKLQEELMGMAAMQPSAMPWQETPTEQSPLPTNPEQTWVPPQQNPTWAIL